MTATETPASVLKTKIDIEQDRRNALIVVLQARLYDLIDLQARMKQAHWNVRGPHFIGLHELFDQFYDQTGEFVDLVAERIGILAGEANGDIRAAGEHSTLPAYPAGVFNGKAHVEAVATSIAAAAKEVRSSIEKAGEYDAGTEDLLTEVSRGLDKQLWFTESHLQADD